MVCKKILLFCLILTSLLYSCGIDNISYLEPPECIHDPTDHGDESQNYFEFKTSDKANLQDAAGFFKGFDIYYRIYESETECITLITNMKAYDQSNPADSVNRLITSHKFKYLNYEGHPSQVRPLISAAATPVSRKVKFRLQPLLSLQNELLIDDGLQGKVLRQNGESFFAVKTGDYDLESSQNPSSDSFYVAVFTSAYGVDTSFRSIYSSLVSLGYVKIRKTE